MAIPKAKRSDEGPVIAIMLALLLAGIGATVYVVHPAHEAYAHTRHEEERLKSEIAREEAQRSKLEILARGLEQDPRVIERVQRDQGAGKPGELRYVPATDSRQSR
jgi:hypothetical protein